MAVNREIADKLLEISALLREQGADPFRVNAYQRAAATISLLPQPVSELVQQKGIEGLVALPAVGTGIARSIYEYVAMGRMSRLEGLRGGHDPLALFEQIPGIGPTLAQRLVEHLHIDSLEALEVALHKHRLEKIPGFGAGKIAMIQAWLAQVLGQRRPQTHEQGAFEEPPVKLLLDIDRRYRERAAAGELPLVSPTRFNPGNEAWLPVMHLSKGGWHFTALYSNSARAHELKHTRDWVVIYGYDDRHHESQQTVVSETRGTLAGRRVVRGREAECLQHYVA